MPSVLATNSACGEPSAFLDSTRNVPGVGPTTWRPINQLNFFWHYKWAPGGADTWLWIGKPENDRLAGGGSLGDYVVGALATVPLSDRVGLYTQVQYMHPSARPGPAGGEENEWNFTTGLTFYPAPQRPQQHRGRPVLDAGHAGGQQRLFPGRHE